MHYQFKFTIGFTQYIPSVFHILYFWNYFFFIVINEVSELMNYGLIIE